MTYRQFHAVFTLPTLVVMGLLISWHDAGTLYGPTVAVLITVVMLFTSPWDNFAVARGIWDFPADRVWFRIRHLPVEEYAFFVIQSLQVIGLCILLLQHSSVPSTETMASDRQPYHWILAAVVSVVWFLIGRKGQGIDLRKPSMHYAWHLLYWFLPVVAVQWAIAGDILCGDRWPIVIVPTLTIGTYLSIADYVAVRKGIWFFDRKQITGTYVAGILPWEEVAFFYLTSLVVAQSFLILLPESAR